MLGDLEKLGEASTLITIKASEYNYDDIYVTVTVEDNAGNKNSHSTHFSIDVSSPDIHSEFLDNNAEQNSDNPFSWQFYKGKKTLRITIKSRSKAYNEAGFNLTINGKKINGKNLAQSSTEAYSLTGLTWNGHHYTNRKYYTDITFNKDGHYTVSASYVDNNQRKFSAQVQTIVQDETAPKAVVKTLDANTKETLAESNTNPASLQYVAFTNQDTILKVEATDATSPLYKAYYFITEGKDAEKLLWPSDSMAWKELAGNGKQATDDLKDGYVWENSNLLRVEEDKKYITYVKVVDYANNPSYYTNYGVVVDKTFTTIDLSYRDPNNNWGYYNEDLPISYVVNDPIKNDCYSGVAKLEYVVVKDVSDEKLDSIARQLR